MQNRKVVSYIKTSKGAHTIMMDLVIVTFNTRSRHQSSPKIRTAKSTSTHGLVDYVTCWKTKLCEIMCKKEISVAVSQCIIHFIQEKFKFLWAVKPTHQTEHSNG